MHFYNYNIIKQSTIYNIYKMCTDNCDNIGLHLSRMKTRQSSQCSDLATTQTHLAMNINQRVSQWLTPSFHHNAPPVDSQMNQHTSLAIVATRNNIADYIWMLRAHTIALYPPQIWWGSVTHLRELLLSH